MQVDDNTIYNAILTGLGAAITWIAASWRRLALRVHELEANGVSRAELDKLRDGSVQKDDFRAYIERADRSREEMLSSVNRLFDRVDEVKTLIIDIKRGGGK